MRLRVTVAIPLAIGLGLIAVQAGRAWLNREVNLRLHSMTAHMRPTPAATQLGTLVVAASPLRFGTQLTPANLREAPWPVSDMPGGGYSRVAELFKHGKARVALASIEPNEPILSSMITGPGEKANLAAIIRKGMKAITIRVDEVIGVAGFVLPGDRVDVLLTHKTGANNVTSDVVEQNIRVLAINQTIDDPSGKPSVARAVTLEVSTKQAQRLILAESVGNLTLVLRPLGTMSVQHESPISLSTLDANAGADKTPHSPMASVSVYRDKTLQVYSVPASD